MCYDKSIKPKKGDFIMKKLVSFLLTCLLLPLGLLACNDEPPAPTPVDPESLSIAGEDISKFKIVYAPAYSAEFLDEFEDFLGDEYEHNLITAEEVQDLISSTFGVSLSIVADTTPETEYEILIGATNRTESSSFTAEKDNQYGVRVVGKKLIVKGGSDGACYHAVSAIQKELAATTVADVAWADGFMIAGEAKMKRIACVGDSLTEGSIGGHVTPELAYPAALGRLLWYDYNVYNYGLGGTTMIGSSANPYMSSQQYADCIGSGMTYDVILVMLGTNDSKVIGETWTDAANTEFMTASMTLFTSLKEKSPNAKFAFMNCPLKFTTAGYGNAYMLPVQKEAATRLVAAGIDVTHYDMRAYTTAVLTSDNFRDGLHPDYAGYAKIAEGTEALVAHLLYGEENEYIIPLN